MRPVIYQLFVRHFSNFCERGVEWGNRDENGCGTFSGVNDAALGALAGMGVTHVWLTGVLRHATQTARGGMEAEPASVVKGKAGSPYAVTDYYDVDPDLADEPAERMEEFRALVQRVRRHGIVPMLDFIPNHVSRCYNSRVRPERQLGAEDNRSVFFARDNAFYYLEPCGSGQCLHLPGGDFAPEQGCGRVTGNNAATWSPGEYDWYETVKLNYGVDYRGGAAAADGLPGMLAGTDEVPRTWREMDAVLAYWQAMGVGGFRCDMAHMIPMPYWRWQTVRCRVRDENILLVAEGYDDHMKMCRGNVIPELLAAGFNAVYDGEAYNLLKSVYEGNTWANDLDHVNHGELPCFAGGVRYLENHDEVRLAAPGQWGNVGGAVHNALAAAQYAATCGPVLIYNGQEFGERAEGPGGFGGDNGRTSIFDYTNLPRLMHWSNGGAYDGAGMSDTEQATRDFLCRLLPLLQHPALSKGGFYGLNWANKGTPGYGRSGAETTSGHYLYAYLRHYRKAKATLLVICNLHPTQTAENVCVHIPTHAREWAGRKDGLCRFRNLLTPDAPVQEATAEQLDAEGLPVSVPAGQALVLEWLL